MSNGGMLIEGRRAVGREESMRVVKQARLMEDLIYETLSQYIWSWVQLTNQYLYSSDELRR